MGTKLTELRNGCFHAAMDDEPMFVLLARDPGAPALVERWVEERAEEIRAGKRPASDMTQLIEARQCAANMRAWRKENDGAWRDGLFAGSDKVAVHVIGDSILTHSDELPEVKIPVAPVKAEDDFNGFNQ